MSWGREAYLFLFQHEILLMAEIPTNHLGCCLKPRRQWNKQPTSTGARRISAINSTTRLQRTHLVAQPRSDCGGFHHVMPENGGSIPQRLGGWVVGSGMLHGRFFPQQKYIPKHRKKQNPTHNHPKKQNPNK